MRKIVSLAAVAGIGLLGLSGCKQENNYPVAETTTEAVPVPGPTSTVAVPVPGPTSTVAVPVPGATVTSTVEATPKP